MTTFIAATVAQIDARLDIARDEMTRLEAARAVLRNGHHAPREKRPRENPSQDALEKLAGARAQRQQQGTKRRAPRGQRQAQLLGVIEATPGITTSAAAAQLGLNQSQTYTLVRRLRADGKIEQDDGAGWRRAGVPASV